MSTTWRFGEVEPVVAMSEGYRYVGIPDRLHYYIGRKRIKLLTVISVRKYGDKAVESVCLLERAVTKFNTPLHCCAKRR